MTINPFFFLAREKGHYRLVGVVLAWSLVHGGPGGNFLSPTLYHAIAHGVDATKPDPKDINDEHLSETLSKVKRML